MAAIFLNTLIIPNIPQPTRKQILKTELLVKSQNNSEKKKKKLKLEVKNIYGLEVNLVQGHKNALPNRSIVASRHQVIAKRMKVQRSHTFHVSIKR